MDKIFKKSNLYMYKDACKYICMYIYIHIYLYTCICKFAYVYLIYKYIMKSF